MKFSVEENTPVIGTDIGKTKIAVVLADHNGEPIASQTIPTNTSGRAEKEITARRISEVIQHHVGQGETRVSGVGFGCVGWIDASTSNVMAASYLGWANATFLDLLCLYTSNALPMILEKDTNAALLVEFHLGTAKGCSDFVFLSIGTRL